jgi:hypothetical protein
LAKNACEVHVETVSLRDSDGATNELIKWIVCGVTGKPVIERKEEYGS